MNYLKYLKLLPPFLSLFLSSPAYAASLNYHEIKFYLDPAMAATASMTTIRTNLSRMVEDMNYILAKNTEKAFVFHPSTGVIVTNAAPFDGIVPAGGAPQTSYEVRVWVQKSDVDGSTGGFHSIDSGGAAVVKDLSWPKFYNPSTLTAATAGDYGRQIARVLRAFGNIHGISRVEGNYFNITDATDPSGGTPPNDMHAFLDMTSLVWNAGDSYWGQKGDYSGEPMITSIYPVTDRTSLRTKYAFSTLSAKVIKSNHRWPTSNPPMASTNGLTVTVIDAKTCLPIEGAQVLIYRTGIYQTPGIIFPLPTYIGSGTYSWNWSSTGDGVFFDQVRYVWINAPGYTPQFFYLTGIDLLSSAVYGSPNWSREVYLNRPNIALSTTSIYSNRIVTVSKLVRGLTWELQSSEDLSNWTTVFATTMTTTTPRMMFPIPTNAPHHLFYRTHVPTACPIPLGLRAPEENQTTAAAAAPAPTSTKTSSPKSTVLPPPLPPMPKAFKK